MNIKKQKQQKLADDKRGFRKNFVAESFSGPAILTFFLILILLVILLLKKMNFLAGLSQIFAKKLKKMSSRIKKSYSALHSS